MRLSLVVPVYKEEKSLEAFLRRVTPILASITEDYEVVFSLDPSPDRSEEIIEGFHQSDPRIKLLKFSRRVGQPKATLAGLEHATGDAVVVIDVDLQDPPELIPELVEKWRAGYEVVYAQRRSREGETWIKRLVAWSGYRLINRIAEVSIPANTGDFRLMSRRVVDHVVSLKESHGFLRGLVALVGFKQAAVPYDRHARFAGSGNYNRLLGSLRIGFNGIICFSSRPLAFCLFLGVAVTAGAFLLLAAVMGTRMAGYEFPLDSPTTVFAVLLIGGVQLLSVGILGEYIGRIYDEVKQRPKYILDRAIGFGRPSSSA
jgi:polyisoprenyl-phosphate glycosyltransferase